MNDLFCHLLFFFFYLNLYISLVHNTLLNLLYLIVQNIICLLNASIKQYWTYSHFYPSSESLNLQGDTIFRFIVIYFDRKGNSPYKFVEAISASFLYKRQNVYSFFTVIVAPEIATATPWYIVPRTLICDMPSFFSVLSSFSISFNSS